MDWIYSIDGQSILIEEQTQNVKRQVAEKFLNCRKEKDITQETLAKAAGMARTNVSRFESGQYNPSLELMIKLAAAMGKKISITLEDI